MLTGGCRMTLADVRKNIDRVDKEIKQLFKERMVLADNVAQVKAETCLLYTSDAADEL